MRVYILRHGETDWNVRHVFQGQTNTSLNENGFAQARRCRDRVQALGLSFDQIYCSPLDRALQTVETVTGADRSRIITDARLLEMNFGPLDGTPFDKKSAVCGHLFDDPTRYVAPEGAESFEELEQRLSSFYMELAKEHPGESILVGCHGCAMRLTLVWMGFLKLRDIWEQSIGNCAIIEAELDEDKLSSAMGGNSDRIADDSIILPASPYRVKRLYETQDWI